jgi:hypothetical protein
MSRKMNTAKTELRLNIGHATEAVEYWLNNYLFKNEQNVESVEWVSMDAQFKIVLKPEPGQDR